MTNAELQRHLASAWESGFHAGEVYGIASERHDPQWDMDPPPTRPENPYFLVLEKNRGTS